MSSGSSSTSRSRNRSWRIRRMKWAALQRRTAPPIITWSCRTGGNRLNTEPLRWMRVPATGGAPRSGVRRARPRGVAIAPCPRRMHVSSPNTTATHLAVYAVDPDQGKGRELARDLSWFSHSGVAALSRDGSRLAIALEDQHPNPYSQTECDGAAEFTGYFRSWLEPVSKR